MHSVARTNGIRGSSRVVPNPKGVVTRASALTVDRAGRVRAGLLSRGLTGQLAPRAVARHETEGQAVRPDRRQRQRPRDEGPQGADGPGADELAVVRAPGR